MSTTEKRHSDPERAQLRRNQVLEAAASCFRRSGFHGASMAEISKAAGMSAGHIYNYFDGKDAIIAAFVEQNVERVAALMHDLEQQDDPLQVMLNEAPVHLAENLAPDFWALPMEIWAEASRNPKVAAVLQDADRRSRIQFRAIIKAGRERHQLPVDDALLDGRIEAVIAIFQGVSVRALHHPELDAAALERACILALKALYFS